MHSKRKLAEHYPMMTDNLLMKLYGNPMNKTVKEKWQNIAKNKVEISRRRLDM